MQKVLTNRFKRNEDFLMKYNKWVTAWGSAVSISENRPESIGKNITLRYPIHLPFDGDQLKIAFDNFCGIEDVTITKATFLYKGCFYPIYFSHNESISIEPGKKIFSDLLPCDIEANTTGYISFYLADYTSLRSSVFLLGPLSEGIYAIGDCTNVENIDISISRKTNIYYFLTDVLIHTSENKHAIVCFGDSITAQAWPDYLTLSCSDTYSDASVIRRAASGSRLLRQYSCITYESYGLSGHNRFEHEVPTEGADILIIQQGINDIIHPVGEDINPFRPMSDLPTVEEMIDELKHYITLARSYGYKIYIGTLLPIEGWRTYAPFREEMRNKYNDWIRNTDLIDGCIDFDKALLDPTNPSSFLKDFDSGDHLHPSLLGYETMAKVALSNLIK